MSEHDAERLRLGFAVRVSALFAAFFFIAGMQLAYLPVWLDWAGLGPRETAIVTAAPLIVRIAATPLIAFAADRSGNYRRVLIALSWAALAALLVLAQARGFWAILAAMLIFAVAWTAIMPLTETVAIGGVRAAGLDYGRMRLWGSLSFIAASFCGGLLVERVGAGAIIWLVVVGGALADIGNTVIMINHFAAAGPTPVGLFLRKVRYIEYQIGQSQHARCDGHADYIAHLHNSTPVLKSGPTVARRPQCSNPRQHF